MASRLEMDIESFAIDTPEPTWVTDTLWPVTVWAGVRDIAAWSQTQKRGGSRSFYHSPGCRLTTYSGGTSHEFDGAAEYAWYTFWHYPDTITNPSAGDSIWIMHFSEGLTSGFSPWLAVVGVVSDDDPITFKYAVDKVEYDGEDYTLTPLVSGATGITMDAGHVIQVEVNWVDPNSHIKLFLDGDPEGAEDTGETENYLTNGAYMLSDTILGAGKGASNFEAYFDDWVANDDVGAGRTTMPDWETYVPEGPPSEGDIKKISGVARADVKKVSGVAEASLSKVAGVDAN